MKNFLHNLPKAELHVHLEGTVAPELLLQIAERNGVKLPYKNLEEAAQAFRFTNYQGFIDAYIQNTLVLKTEQDFYDITWSYLLELEAQGVKHVEISFDLQTYMPRNIAPEKIINGIYSALHDGEKQLGITGLMIMCFIRHLPESDAFKALEATLPFKDKIVAVGLASVEKENPPEKFARVFAAAKEHGFRLTAHAGECFDFIEQTIDLLHVERIDHGIRAAENQELMHKIASLGIPLTLCPQSNICLGIYKNIGQYPIRKLLESDIKITINSDDPAFFNASVLDNYKMLEQLLTREELIACARRSFEVSFLSEEKKSKHLHDFNKYLRERRK